MNKEAGSLVKDCAEFLGKEVSVKQIDRELREIFASDKGIARASLTNLAIYNEEGNQANRNTGIIQDLTREHACRALLVVSQPVGEREVRAWVQAHCNIGSGGEKAVCSEQVSFLLCGSSADLVRNIVFAHLDSDLPLIFWWQGELSEVFEDRLYSRIDRLIVDSRDWAEPAAQFLRLVAAVKGSGASYVMHDLAYTQSNQLREAVAVCFDEPAAQKVIETLSKVEICYATGQRMTAVWLMAWLANRLKLELNTLRSSRDAYAFERSGSQHGNEVRSESFQICLEEDGKTKGASESCEDASGGAKADIQPSPILRVSLLAGKDGARFDIVRSDDGQGNVFWRLGREIPGWSESYELWPTRSFGDVDLVHEILMRAGQNRLMNELLPLVRSLLGVAN